MIRKLISLFIVVLLVFAVTTVFAGEKIDKPDKVGKPDGKSVNKGPDKVKWLKSWKKADKVAKKTGKHKLEYYYTTGG